MIIIKVKVGGARKVVVFDDNTEVETVAIGGGEMWVYQAQDNVRQQNRGY